jgi:hypothetical protein
MQRIEEAMSTFYEGQEGLPELLLLKEPSSNWVTPQKSMMPEVNVKRIITIFLLPDNEAVHLIVRDIHEMMFK